MGDRRGGVGGATVSTATKPAAVLAMCGHGIFALQGRRKDDDGHGRVAARVADEVVTATGNEYDVAGDDRALVAFHGERRRASHHHDREIVASMDVGRLRVPYLYEMMAHGFATPQLEGPDVRSRWERICREERVELGIDRSRTRIAVVEDQARRASRRMRARDRRQRACEDRSGAASNAGAARGLDLRSRFRHNARAPRRRIVRSFPQPQASIVGPSASTVMKREAIGLVALLLHAACSAETPETTTPYRAVPPTARMEIVETLEEDLRAARHPADGGGSVWIEDTGGEKGARVSTPGRWTLVYEAGPLGIAAGGTLFFQPSPFWGWSSPQTTDADAFGFTDLSTEARGVELLPKSLGNELLAVEIAGRALASGERVRLVYGAGSRGALADRYAERGSRLWIAVDGDGDGVRALVPDSPRLDVRAGPPARLEIVLPTTARPGADVRVVIAALDATGSTGVDVSGVVRFVDVPAGIDIPATVQLEPGVGGRAVLSARVHGQGIYRLRAVGPEGLTAESNPLEVSAHGPRILWGDLHGHSNLSDGTGVPEDYFTYARDVAALDVVALTDHDHWGMQFIDQHPELWTDISAQTARFHDPHRFVTLLGYEWTSWIYGHRHVLYFADSGAVHSSLDPATTTPAGLWAALAGVDAVTIAHHSAGGPIAVDWTVAPDPRFEPVTEVVSVHGSSEAADSPSRIYDAVADNFVRDALDRGYRLGFVGSGDSHDGHPGNAHFAGPTGGLVAILSEELTRTAVLEALRARRVYATSGPRLLLRASLGGTRMGGVLSTATAGGAQDLAVRAVGTARLSHIDVVRSGAIVETLACDGALECSALRPLAGLGAGEYVYVRVVQEDGALAWSSPVFID